MESPLRTFTPETVGTGILVSSWCHLCSTKEDGKRAPHKASYSERCFPTWSCGRSCCESSYPLDGSRCCWRRHERSHRSVPRWAAPPPPLVQADGLALVAQPPYLFGDLCRWVEKHGGCCEDWAITCRQTFLVAQSCARCVPVKSRMSLESANTPDLRSAHW